MVIIDVLQRIKPSGGSRTQTSYERDYAVYAPLQSYAAKHRLAILGLHHTRKGGADDPLEALSGSNGLSAVADTTLLLDRTAEGVTLYVRGRDVPERDAALRSVDGQWQLQGDAIEVRRSAQRNDILDTLRSGREPLTPRDVSDLTGGSQTAVRQMLVRMANKGEIERVGRGQYTIPCHIGHDRHDAQRDDADGAHVVGFRGDDVVTPLRDTACGREHRSHENGASSAAARSYGSLTAVTAMRDVTPTNCDIATDEAVSGAGKHKRLSDGREQVDPVVTAVTDVTPPRKDGAS